MSLEVYEFWLSQPTVLIVLQVVLPLHMPIAHAAQYLLPLHMPIPIDVQYLLPLHVLVPPT